MTRTDLWAPSTRKAHGQPCLKCGVTTYCKDGFCKVCKKTPTGFPPVEALPEDYLMRCAEELLKRHQKRDELLRTLGIREAA